MSNLMMWSLIVGFLAPNLIALVQQPRFTSQMRAGIMFVASVVGGGLTAYFNGQFNFEDVVGSILTVGVASITFYKGLWKPTGVATGIENATSKTPPTVEQVHPEDAPDRAYDERGESLLYVALVVLVIVAIVVLLF